MYDATLAKLSAELKLGDAVVVTMMAVRANSQTMGIWSGDGFRRSVMAAIPRLHNVTQAAGAKLLLVGGTPSATFFLPFCRLGGAPSLVGGGAG